MSDKKTQTQSLKPQPIPVDVKAVKEQHPEAIVLDLDQDGEIYTFAFARPKRQHVDLAMSGAAKKMPHNMLRMALTLLLAPSREEAAQIFEYYPGMPSALGGQLLEAVGLKDAEVRP